MCGRITTLQWDELLAAFHCIETDTPFNAYPDWPAKTGDHIDAFPRREVPLICSSREGRIIPEKKIWGYVPEGHTDLVFNTRIENADKYGLWKQSYENRHCVVPVHAFYEPHKAEKAISAKGREVKQLYRFTEEGSPIILLCGIWEGDRFSILTMPPNDQMRPIHPRMPVMLSETEAGQWLKFQGLKIQDDVPLVARPVYERKYLEQAELF